MLLDLECDINIHAVDRGNLTEENTRNCSFSIDLWAS